jgi:hypothetical protein
MEMVAQRVRPAPSTQASRHSGRPAKTGVWSGGGLSALLIVAGAAPFVAGLVASRSKIAMRVAGLSACPLRALTGVPCPSCGATRTFVAVAGGDGEWRRGNAPLVWYAAALVAAGVTLAALPPDRRDALAESAHSASAWLRRHPALAAAAVIALSVPPWLVARHVAAGEGLR